MTKRVRLSRSYVAFGAPVDVAIVSEPTGGLYLDLGEPYERQFTASGEPVVIENTVAVRGYIEGCVTFPDNGDPVPILRQLSLADIRAVKREVLGFFEGAKGSTASSPSSHGAPDGTPPTSSE